MTTLPQTTPIRMPRPGATPTPVVAVPGPGQVPHLSPAQAGLSFADAWRVVRAHTWLIVAMVFVSAVGGYFLNQHLEKYHSRFVAKGLIQFQPTTNYDPIRNPNPSIDPTVMGLELQTQAQTIRTDKLLTELLINPNSRVRQTVWFMQFPTAQAAKESLAKNLSVTPIPGTRLIEVSMTTPIAKDSRTIVEELGDLHINTQKTIAQDRQTERSRLLNLRRKELLDRERTARNNMTEKATLLIQRGFDPNQGINNNKNEELLLSAEQMRLGTEINDLQNRLSSLVNRIKAGDDPAEMVASVEGDQQVTALRNAIERIDMEISLLPQVGEEHPRHKRFMLEREAYAAKLEKLRTDLLAALRISTLEGLTNTLAAKKARYDTLGREVEEKKKVNTGLDLTYREYNLAKDDQAAAKLELKEVNDSLDQIKMIGQTEIGAVTWSTKPTTPESPAFPKLPTTMALSILSGLALALGIAFLRELTDKTVRSPRDIARLGQLNMLGMVSDINDDAQSAGAKLPLVIYEAPHAIIAEQFRQVRTRMQHAASLDSTRSILVTSPGAGDGKSTVACNLAAGLALNGRRILLVDANFRRPELHKVFGLSNDAGFSDALNQLDTLAANIRETHVPNLHVLTSGAKPLNATELFESQLLVDFIEKALEEFDHVVFDSGPLLVVSETVALAPRVDGVITVVRARHNSRGLLIRMRDTLKQLKAEHLGVILNGVRAQGGGYYGRNIKAYYAYGDADAPQLTGPTTGV